MTKLIALNPARAGNKGRISALTLADYDRLTHEDWLRQQIAAIRAGQRELKAQLPFRSPHYYAFADNRRCQNAILPEKFLFQTCVDIDDADKVSMAIDKAREVNEQPGKWRGKLLHMDYSASHKLHIDLRLPVGMTIEETQQQYCELLGIPYDKSCITPERIIFITSADDELYRSDSWYQIMADEDLKMYRDALTDRGLRMDGQIINKNYDNDYHPASHPVSPSPVSPAAAPVETPSPEYLKKNARKNLIIFDLCRRQAGLETVDIDEFGSRHTSLLSIMSVGAARLMNADDLMNTVKLRMPEYAKSQNCAQLINDFYSKYHEFSKQYSPACQKILAEAERQVKDIPSADQTEEEKPASPLWEKLNPRYLPDGLRQCLSGAPKNLYLPIICSILPIAGAYADQAQFLYCDGGTQYLGFMSIIVGDQASGKSYCKEVVDVWKKTLEDEDVSQREIEEAWKEKKRCRKATEKAPEDPRPLIRVIAPTISNSAFLRRQINALMHCLYSFCEELDTMVKSNGAGSWANKDDVFRMSFDRSFWGQDYISDQAVSGIVRVAYNWTMLGTYGALYRCFTKKNVENGLSSRILVSEMPNSDFAPMPKLRRLSDVDKGHVYAAVAKLRTYKGFIDTPKLRRTIGKWVEQKRLEALKDGDKVKDVYRKRAAVIGFRAGCIYRLLSGEEDKHCQDFAVMIAEYCLYEQMRLFGSILQSCWDEERFTPGIYKSANNLLYDKLPNEFTLENLIKQKGDSINAIRAMVSRWVKNKLVEKKEKNHWVKCKIKQK